MKTATSIVITGCQLDKSQAKHKHHISCHLTATKPFETTFWVNQGTSNDAAAQPMAKQCCKLKR